jgi:hypothetical protein
MAKRGPKRDRYEKADRMYRLRALDLVEAGESRWAAAQAVVDGKMEGIGSDYSKARRIHSWLVANGDAAPAVVKLFETAKAFGDMFGKLAAKDRN